MRTLFAMMMVVACAFSSPHCQRGKKEDLVIHMMFFPWDEQQRFKEDEFAFDPKPYHAMVKKHPEATVILWTYSKTKAFCLENYPEIWQALEKYSSRPVMYIDILRHLVVYHYGGIYWQYDSVMRSKKLQEYLPTEGKRVKFFTEKVTTSLFAEQMKEMAIRKGEPEECTRVATQVFSASTPKDPKIKELLAFLIDRMQRHTAHCDYDILYITGNAAMSEFYDHACSHDPAIELVSYEKAKQLVRWNPKGRWRTDLR